MCGIVGMAGLIGKHELEVFNALIKLDTIRGQDSTGIFTVTPKKRSVDVYKTLTDGFQFAETNGYKDLATPDKCLILGHNRAATQGDITLPNAHPFTHKHITGVHNGTLAESYKDLLHNARKFGTDSEALIHSIAEKGLDWTLQRAHGAYALVWYDENEHTLNFIKNKERPLCFGWNADARVFWWSSDPEIFDLARHYSRYDSALFQKKDMMYSFNDNVHYKIDLPKDYTTRFKPHASTSTIFSHREDKSNLAKVYVTVTNKPANRVGKHGNKRHGKNVEPEHISHQGMKDFSAWDTKTKTTIHADLARIKKDKDIAKKAEKEGEEFAYFSMDGRSITAQRAAEKSAAESAKVFGYSVETAGNTTRTVPLGPVMDFNFKAGESPFKDSPPTRKFDNIIPFARSGTSSKVLTASEQRIALNLIERDYKRFFVNSATRYDQKGYMNHLQNNLPFNLVELSKIKADHKKLLDKPETMYQLYRDSFDRDHHKYVISLLRRREFLEDIISFTETKNLIPAVRFKTPLETLSLCNDIMDGKHAVQPIPRSVLDLMRREDLGDDALEAINNSPSGFLNLTIAEYEAKMLSSRCENCSCTDIRWDPEEVIPLESNGIICPECAETSEVKEFFKEGLITRAS